MRLIIVKSPVVTFLKNFSTSTTLWNTSGKIRKSQEIKDLLLSMSKDRGHVQQMRVSRKQKKDCSPRYTPGVVRLQVLGNGAPGHPSSLYLFTDSNRYLFNCGEGTQRLAHEYKVKLGTLEHIFLTQSTWEKIGGLPGAALTIQDIGVPALYLHGPPGLVSKLFILHAEMRKYFFFQLYCARIAHICTLYAGQTVRSYKKICSPERTGDSCCRFHYFDNT